ncbi:Amidase [Collimonas sp. OK607]|uniref:amidase family protein n=1 Tax=Collimonas sp. OK607 TaxID=1798194 RepID=UPI0008DF2AD4|nr:amidase family protein [Collimonas sp. OK607]SFB01724.1 Amidase [Collimonas sp. OK607]
MSKKPIPAKVAGSRHREAPFLQERERYLRHCAESGATSGSLSVKRNELIWIACFLPPTAPQGVDINQLHELVQQRAALHTGVTMGYRMIVVARPWLRFLGWWREPIMVLPFQGHLDSYIKWMRDERGFSPSTVDQWQGRIMVGVFAREHLDTLVYPTIGQKPSFIGELQGGWENCQLSATTGLPAMALPVGWTADGLSVGLELLGAEFAEPTLLNLAYGWEKTMRPRRAPYTTPPLVAGKAPRLQTLDTVHFGKNGNTADVHFTYDATTGRLEYRARTHNIKATDVIGITLQRGEPNKPGPIIWNILKMGQTSSEASMVLRGKDREDFVAGQLFVQLYTSDAPLGVAGQTVRMCSIPCRPESTTAATR